MATNGTSGAYIDIPATDPIKYDVHHQTFSGHPLPKDVDSWLERASQVAKIFAEDAGPRGREQKAPTAEVALLKSSGLLKVLGPKEHGGGGQGWEVAYKVIREVAKGDGYVNLLESEPRSQLEPA